MKIKPLLIPLTLGLGLTLVFITLLSILAQPIQAANFDLTGSCPGNVGDVNQLTTTIQTANGNGQTDLIILKANCIYTLTTVDNSTDGANGLPSIVSPLVISGNGATIQRDNGATNFRLFHNVDNLTLDNVTLRNGVATGGTCATVNPCGGAILIKGGALTVTGSTLANNFSDAYGGGLGNNNGNTTITNSTFLSNTAARRGGAIYNAPLDSLGQATLTITSSAFLSNTAAGGSVWGGGAIYNDSARMTIMNSTFAGNTTTESGGAIYSESGGFGTATTTITNSTFSGNVANSLGGAIYNRSLMGINNSTFTDNTALIIGGGIRQLNGTLTIANSIVANNSGGDCRGTLISGGYNLIKNSSNCTITGDTTGLITGLDPLLGLLANNDGNTQTHALLANSPALEGAVCISSLTTDQRGQPRPNPGETLCDIGAYESNLTAVRDLSINKSVTPNLIQAGQIITYTLTFSNVGVGLAQNVIITDEMPVSLTNVSVVSSGVVITDTWVNPAYVWSVQDLAPSNEGIITITAQISASQGTFIITNTTTITTTSEESNTVNNTTSVGISSSSSNIYLPIICKFC